MCCISKAKFCWFFFFSVLYIIWAAHGSEEMNWLPEGCRFKSQDCAEVALSKAPNLHWYPGTVKCCLLVLAHLCYKNALLVIGVKA